MILQVLTSSHYPKLVILSVLVAILASLTVLKLMRFLIDSNGREQQFWLVMTSAAMGLGVWSMHFIAMLAVKLPIEVSYDPVITFASLVVVTFASALAIYPVRGGRLNRSSWLWGGVITGLGLSAMHYMGLAAMRMPASLRFEPLLVVASVLVAIVAGLVLMRLLTARQRNNNGLRQLAGAMILGSVLVSMHYTGMGATNFMVADGMAKMEAEQLVSQTWFGVVIAISVLVIFSFSLLMTILDQQLLQRMLSSRHFICRYWVLLVALFYMFIFWITEAIMHDVFFDQHQQGFVQHLLTDDPNEIWMRLVIVVTALGFAIIGQHLFNQSKKLTDKLIITQEQQEEIIKSRTIDLQESQHRVRAILDTSYDAFVATNSKGRIIDWNPAAQSLFGWDSSEVIGRQIVEKLFPDYPPARSILPGIGFTQDEVLESSHTHELTASRHDGVTFPVSISLSPLELASGIVFNIVIRDISERKQQEENLHQAKFGAEKASRLKSEFLANLSHELRTPLNAIIGFSEILKDNLVGDLNSEQQDYVCEVFDSSQHLLSLINDILDLSKVEAGKMALEPGTVDLSSLLENSFTIIREKAHAHGIKLELELAENLELVELDERKFKQMIFNLLSNAVKFTEDGGRIGLVAGVKDEWLDIIVWDSGIGISKDDQARLFQPFMQADGSVARNFEGTGLGLSLVKSFAQLHGGDISVESSLGNGSRFKLRLPYRKVDTQADIESTAQIRPVQVGISNKKAFKLLIIEDNEQAAALMMVQLKDEGYQTVWARTGEEGLALAEDIRPDSILLDIMLPSMDGWEVLQKFKSSPQLSEIPVVIVSIVADASKGLTLGAMETLEKPLSRESLLAVVKRASDTVDKAQKTWVLVVGDDAKACGMIRLQLESQGYKVDCAKGGADGIGQLQNITPDLVILDLIMKDVTGFDVLAVMRMHKQLAHTPAIILSAKTLTVKELEFLQQHTANVIEKTDFNDVTFMESIKDSLRGKVISRDESDDNKFEDKSNDEVGVMGAEQSTGDALSV